MGEPDALRWNAMSSTVTVGNVTFSNRSPLALIAGPCQMESRAHALETASALKEITSKLGLGLVYKSSFDKANRTSANAQRASGLRLRYRFSPKSARRSACRH